MSWHRVFDGMVVSAFESFAREALRHAMLWVHHRNLDMNIIQKSYAYHTTLHHIILC